MSRQTLLQPWHLAARPALLTVLLSLLPTLAAAAVSATVDRNPVMVGETFNLTVRATEDTGGAPDWSPLEARFRVLNTVSGSEYRLVNGRASQSRHWTVTLAATQPGDAEIPPITVGAQATTPIPLTVVAPDAGNGPRDAFVEFEAERTSVYVQEQLLLTVRLYVSGDLVSGQLGEPSAPQAVIEQIGEQSESRAIRDGQRYHLFERRYVLFAEQPGPLTVAPPQFTGEISTGRRRSSMFNLGQFAGQTRQIFAEGDPVTLQIKPPPADWTGPWLPASGVELEQSLVPNSGPFVAGEPFSRVTELVIDGQLHTQIDPLTPEQPEGVQAYGEPASTETSESRNGVRARLAQQWALIANQAGELVLPEVRLRWWDTRSDQARESVIPERRITIDPGAIPRGQPERPATGANGLTPDPVVKPTPPQRVVDAGLWPWLALVLGLGWLLTVAAWLVSAGRRSSANSRKPPERKVVSLQALLAAVESGHPAAARKALLAWGQQRHAPLPVRSLEELARREAAPGLAEALAELDAALYSGPHAPAWSADQLRRCLRQLPRHPTASEHAVGLPPLYPQSASSTGV